MIDLRLSVLKITNIPWDLTSEEVIGFLECDDDDGHSDNMNASIKSIKSANNHSSTTDIKGIWKGKKKEHWSFSKVKHDHIHIPIDRLSGKTRGELFVECGSPLQIKYWISKLDGKWMGKRMVKLSVGDWDELIRVHFATYNSFPSPLAATGIEKPIPKSTLVPLEGAETWPESNTKKVGVLQRSEMRSLLEICKNYKGHFSRKCASRPFEHVISLFRLSYWWALGEGDKKVMFTLGQESLTALMEHLVRSGRSRQQKIPFSLLYRLLKAVLDYHFFTEEERNAIRDINGIQNFLMDNLFIGAE